MARLLRAGLLGTLALLGGCAMAPAYHPPTVALPNQFKESAPWVPAQPGAEARTGPWWLQFNDATLNGLEESLASNSPGVQAALGRYDAAQAYLAEARSAALPQIGLSGNVTRNRQSDHRPLRGNNQPDLYAADSISGGAYFDFDLWGRIRNSVAAGQADAQASADDLAAVLLGLETQLASSYLLLRGYDREIELLTATAAAYDQADVMTRRRFAGGIANGIEIGQSGTQLAEARAQLADLRNARALTEHAIASLVGTPASTFSLPANKEEVPFALPRLPEGVPSTLLQRRPDIAAAERRMFAANRRIGVAKGAFFPDLTLGGTGGFQSTALAGLVAAPNIFWSLGPGVVFSLFDGGRNKARLQGAKAVWIQATAEYRARVLGAVQDVEDGLSRLHYLDAELTAEQQAVSEAGQVEQLSLNRYRKGAVNYLDVVTAQTTALRTRRQAIQLGTRRLLATVGLIAALGGGWDGTHVARTESGPQTARSGLPSEQR